MLTETSRQGEARYTVATLLCRTTPTLGRLYLACIVDRPRALSCGQINSSQVQDYARDPPSLGLGQKIRRNRSCSERIGERKRRCALV